MGSPQNPAARARQKKRRRVKEARLRDAKEAVAAKAETKPEAKK